MGKKILIVDDSSTVRQQVALALHEAGFETVEACDGHEGLEALRKTDDLDMVICDVNMPRMNGIEMVVEAKKDASFSGIPIVMLTTEGQPALIRKAKEAGASGWIVKPFNPDRLVATARKLTDS